jgi:hypothetical protein
VSVHGEGKASEHDSSSRLESDGWSDSHFSVKQVTS